MHPSELLPAVEIGQGDVEILGMLLHMAGNPLPVAGAILTAKMVVGSGHFRRWDTPARYYWQVPPHPNP